MANKQYSASKWFREFGKALDPGVIKSSLYALLVGLIGGLVAQGLLELIYLFTNLFFFGKWSFAINYPVGNHLGAWVILIPPIGGLLVGIMVHYWEPTLKGHGIPEAMEAVLVGKSKVRMRVGILKPLATAFAIGTGGPFGAEGPIIMTGGAFGSMIAQFFHLTSVERKPIPSLDGLRNIRRLLAVLNPKAASVKIEELVDSRLIRKLDENGFIDKVGASYGLK